LTVKETLNGNTVATSQTITVTDPPVSPPTSTTTPNATVIPVAQTPTRTATKMVGSQRNVTSATVDEAIAVALNTAVMVAVALDTAVADADGAKMPSLTISGDGTAADITDPVSGSDSLTVDPGAALKLSRISH